MSVLVRRSWTRLWWVARNGEEPVGLIDSPTCYRALTREAAIARVGRVKPNPWETVEASSDSISSAEEEA